MAPRIWTCTNPWKTTESEADDYDEWTIEQLRKEYIIRKVRVPRTHASLQRIELLQQYDHIKLGVKIGVLGEK